MEKAKRLTIKTIKMSLACVISIFIARLIGLEYYLTTGIVAIITITDTRLASFNLAITRFWSTLIAFIVSSIVFLILDFDLIAFFIFLIIYIPLASILKLEVGISNSIVLVTHFILAESVSMKWQINGFLIMLIGVSTALVFNHYFAPSYKKNLEGKVKEIEDDFIKIIYEMVDLINNKPKNKSMVHINSALRNLKENIGKLYKLGLDEYNNKRPYGKYYVDYSRMRENQRKILVNISSLIEQLSLDIEENEKLTSIFVETANTFDEKNDVKALIESITRLYKYFRNSNLPKTREEFEDRARLFTILSYFESFLELKRDFYINH